MDRWEPIESLIPAEASPYAQFGDSVVLTETTLVVSASHDSSVASKAGAVYVYSIDTTAVPPSDLPLVANATRQAPTKLMAILHPSTNSDHAYFGRCIAFTDTTGFVTATQADGSGVVYVFEKQSTKWIAVQLLMSDQASLLARFGDSLALTTASGQNIALVGAPGDYWQPGSGFAGLISLYAEGDDGQWTAMGKFTGNTTHPFDGYGGSIATANDRVFVGAELADGFTPRSGAVMVEYSLLEYLTSTASPSDSGGNGSNPGDSMSYSNPDSIEGKDVLTIVLVVMAVLPAITIAGVLATRASNAVRRLIGSRQQPFSLVVNTNDHDHEDDVDGPIGIPIERSSVEANPLQVKQAKENSASREHLNIDV